VFASLVFYSLLSNMMQCFLFGGELVFFCVLCIFDLQTTHLILPVTRGIVGNNKSDYCCIPSI
jgi:hypothetical protein